MTAKQKAKPATKEQKRRFEAMKELGCIACLENDEKGVIRVTKLQEWRLPDIHHMLAGTVRAGHDKTVPLCNWHHTGVSNCPMSNSDSLKYIGPSWHKHRRAFRERYGSDAELVTKVNLLLAEKGLYP